MQDRLQSVILFIFVALLAGGCGAAPEPSAMRESEDGLAGVPFDPTAMMRPELIEVQPEVAMPGDELRVTYRKPVSRGIGYTLEEAGVNSWRLRYMLAAAKPNDGAPRWWTPEERIGWPDEGFDDHGPDVLLVPPTAGSGSYRVCTGNAAENVCTSLQILEGPRE